MSVLVCQYTRTKLNIDTQGVQELCFCDLKPPGGSSTQWTLKSYDKGNSFTYTGPGFPAFNVIIEFNCLLSFSILKEQERVYRELYKSSINSPNIGDKVSSFLNDLNIPQLPEEEKN